VYEGELKGGRSGSRKRTVITPEKGKTYVLNTPQVGSKGEEGGLHGSSERTGTKVSNDLNGYSFMSSVGSQEGNWTKLVKALSAKEADWGSHHMRKSGVNEGRIKKDTGQ